MRFLAPAGRASEVVVAIGGDEGKGEEVELTRADLDRLGGWVTNKRHEIESDPVIADRLVFWIRVARNLNPESLGILLTAKEMNEERDPITGILNRKGLENALAETLDWETRTKQPVTLVLMELDEFSTFNQVYGREAADAILEEWVRFLQGAMRKTDLLGRYGGHELVAVLRGANEEQGAVLFERIRDQMAEALKRRLSDLGVTDPITMSVGVAEHRPDDEPRDLLEQARDRTAHARLAGRNVVVRGRGTTRS